MGTEVPPNGTGPGFSVFKNVIGLSGLELKSGMLKYSFSGLVLALCVLLTAAFVVGCGATAGQPTPIDDDTQPIGQFTPIGGGELAGPSHAYTVSGGGTTVTFIAISSGDVHTCGLQGDGSAVCWGSNEDGQSSPPEGETFTNISSGAFHTCGLREDGATECWGIRSSLIHP